MPQARYSWSVLISSAIVVLASSPFIMAQLSENENTSASGVAQLPVRLVQPPLQEFHPNVVAYWWAPPPAGKGKGGSRGDDYAIVPSGGEGMNIIWRDRPVLIWEGALGQVEILDEDSGELLWSQTVSPDDRYIAYTGAALQPGRLYEWILGDSFGVSVDLVIFQLMEAVERDRITAELAELEASLNAEAAEIALQRANYFANRNLWAEVLQEAILAKDSSAELTELLQPFLPQQSAAQ